MPNVTISYYYGPMENNKRIHIYERFPIDQFKLNGCINFEGFQSNDDFAKCYDILTRAKYLNVVVRIKTERTTIRCKLGNAHLITDMDINHCGKNIRISEADPLQGVKDNINAKYGVTNVKFMKTCVKPIPKKVYYNNPYTVVIWKDGTKTVVKAPNKHAYNRLTGFMLCYMEKQSGMTKTQFHKWLESMGCYK